MECSGNGPPEDFEKLIRLQLERPEYFHLQSWPPSDPLLQRLIFGARPQTDGILLEGDFECFVWLLEHCIDISGHLASDEAEANNHLCRRLDSLIRMLEEAAVSADPPMSNNGQPELVLPSWLPSDLAEQLERALTETEFEDLDDLNEHLRQSVEVYNECPQQDLGGLSPRQLHDLISIAWQDRNACPIRFTEELDEKALSGSRLWGNCRLFLSALIEMKGTPATVAGNLNRRFVNQMFQGFTGPDGWRESVRRVNKVLNEHDVGRIHLVRVICELAGLVRRRKKRFVATVKARKMMKSPGSLFLELFLTHFQRLNLAYLDGYPEDTAIQDTVAFSFYLLHRRPRRWENGKKLSREIILAEIGSNEDLHLRSVETRILAPLVEFGLLERRPASRKPQQLFRSYQYRRSPLFHRFIDFLF